MGSPSCSYPSARDSSQRRQGRLIRNRPDSPRAKLSTSAITSPCFCHPRPFRRRPNPFLLHRLQTCCRYSHTAVLMLAAMYARLARDHYATSCNSDLHESSGGRDLGDLLSHPLSEHRPWCSTLTISTTSPFLQVRRHPQTVLCISTMGNKERHARFNEDPIVDVRSFSSLASSASPLAPSTFQDGSSLPVLSFPHRSQVRGVQCHGRGWEGRHIPDVRVTH